MTSGTLREVQEGALPTTSLRLVFNFNNITSFPFASLSSFSPGLLSLDLRSNALGEFPALASSTLQTLYLSNNPLGSLPVSAFVSTPSLVDLHLSNTQIPEVFTGTFTPLTQLVNLGLGNNLLRRLEEGAIQAATSLALIDLGYNTLTYVHPQAFPGFTNGWLYIHHNGLTKLEENVWRTVMQGPEAYLDPYGNPLQCGCDVAWLVSDPTLMAKVDIYTTCADGRPLISLDPEEFQAC
ncbi:hypothetical protein Pcinc_039060 [Petrolisthes cinctipes]|uniref:Uncharacterized protein n=1 Tax=Petrolisthes cinctipes TaxID=88211 RepID=A0AAE1BPE0_PETCI|nr:hypothetical protein Pcinc_039060 [Petrolisthes cinctipes]